MRVQSPVGTFPVSLRGVRLTRSGPAIETSMGVWRSQVSFDRGDLPLASAVIAGAALLVAAGRISASRRR